MLSIKSHFLQNQVWWFRHSFYMILLNVYVRPGGCMGNHDTIWVRFFFGEKSWPYWQWFIQSSGVSYDFLESVPCGWAWPGFSLHDLGAARSLTLLFPIIEGLSAELTVWIWGPLRHRAGPDAEPYQQRGGAAVRDPGWPGAAEPGVPGAAGRQGPAGVWDQHIPEPSGEWRLQVCMI